MRFSDVTITLDRPLERALAARLALARGVAVSDERLARDLWGDVDLARPRERLRVLASRLRANLGEAAAALSRTGAGYVLDASPSDVVAAEQALSDGSREAIVAALALWRGDSLADLRAVPFGFAEGERLDALRVDLRVAHLAVQQEAGAGIELRAELEELVGEHPLHERLSCMLALALYRGGRQADALAVLSRLRTRLSDELGVDPAPETLSMELKILRQEALGGAPRRRLPEAGTTFLGRDADRAAIAERLSVTRLVTLTGVAGSGKTRLALEVARVVERPVVWLDLTAVRAEDEILPALIAEAGEDYLAELEGALLVVDNAEHVLSAASSVVSDLLSATGKLSVLATSQRPLLAEGEEVRHVGPLPPVAASLLFCDRSGAEPSADVDSICAAVDHLPLGVELAAGLTRTLSVQQLAGRLDDRLRLLVGGLRGSRQRHSSLRAALDWSHELLDDVQQAVLRRAGVFLGGWTLEAAEEVLAFDGVEVADVAATLTELADRNLIAVSEGPRFRMLETVRHYALDKLREEEDEAVRARHLGWCSGFVAARDVRGDAATVMGELSAEWPNLLSAMESAAGTPRAGAGLRLAVAMQDAWMVRGLVVQAARVYEALIDAPVPDDVRALALCNYGFFCTQIGRLSLASSLLDRAAPLAEGDDQLTIRVLYYRAITEIQRGRPAQAISWAERGYAVAERIEHVTYVSALGCVLAIAQMYAGDLDASLRNHLAANAIDRSLGDEHGLARGLVNESMTLLSGGDTAAALARADEAEALSDRLGDAIGATHVGMIRARAALLDDRLDEAVDRLRTVLDDAEAGADTGLLRVDLAWALLRRGDLAEARAELALAASVSDEQDLTWLAVQPVTAALVAQEGDLARAGEVAAAARAEFAARGFGWPFTVDRLEAL
ncbi:ATP-binding protein [Lentzea flava]|uniref:ATP-binding protein n=1 Tax=Lentzea flava TaxID=103732 RepID=UPI00166FCC76|nr:BTAD domain-containing putative transcriptional regulator [Lentzea flava]MCP2204474.1 putative ATPase [Lentzea flava]